MTHSYQDKSGWNDSIGSIYRSRDASLIIAAAFQTKVA